MSNKHYVLLLLISFLFGSAYPAQKLISNEMPTLIIIIGGVIVISSIYLLNKLN